MSIPKHKTSHAFSRRVLIEPQSIKDMHVVPGRDGSLIAFEGVDGSGKSTQLDLIAHWLQTNGFAVLKMQWTGSETIKPLLKKIKNTPIVVNPYVFSLLYAADVSEWVTKSVQQALKAGFIVLCDRYVYTAYTRDTARGLPLQWVKDLYQFAPEPDMTFYFKVTPETAISRKTNMPKFYEAGMDIGISKNPKKAFESFQRRIISGYDALTAQHQFRVVDGSDRIYNTFPKVKRQLITFIKAKYNIDLPW